jgi:hypothetical protein
MSGNTRVSAVFLPYQSNCFSATILCSALDREVMWRHYESSDAGEDGAKRT